MAPDVVSTRQQASARVRQVGAIDHPVPIGVDQCRATHGSERRSPGHVEPYLGDGRAVRHVDEVQEEIVRIDRHARGRHDGEAPSLHRADRCYRWAGRGPMEIRIGPIARPDRQRLCGVAHVDSREVRDSYPMSGHGHRVNRAAIVDVPRCDSAVHRGAGIVVGPIRGHSRQVVPQPAEFRRRHEGP
jgi:hypothetical protein